MKLVPTISVCALAACTALAINAFAEGGRSRPKMMVFFFFNDTAPTEIYTLSLHDALPLSPFWLMPSQPKALPDMPPYPALQPVDRSAILSQSVVPPPASYILPPCVPQLVAGSALAASPLLPYLRFESFQALRCRFNLPIAG